MAQQQVTLTITAKDDGTVLAVTQGMDKLVKAAERAGSVASKPIAPKVDPSGVINLKDHFSSLTFGMQKFARVAVSLQVIMATVTTFLGIRAIVDASDAWNQMSGRLRLVTSSTEELAAVQSKLFTLAQELRLPMEDVAKLYTRLAVNAEALGLSQAQVLSVTRSVSQAMQVSGSTAAEAAAGVLQFTQAIASSNFAGDELRTLLESQPRLLKAMADGLKILSPEFRKLTEGGQASTAALRKMGQEGKLSADLLLAAISTQRDVLEREFMQLPRTVGQAWTQAMNVINRALAGVSVAPLTNAIDTIKEKFQDSDSAQRFTRILSGGLELVGGSLQLVIGIVDRLALAFDGLILKQLAFWSAGIITSSNTGALLSALAQSFDNMLKTFLGLPAWIQAVGLIGAYMFGRAGVVGLMAGVTLYERLAKNVQALKEGMSFKDFAFSGPADIDAYLKKMEEARADSPSEQNALKSQAMLENMRVADIQLKQHANTLEQIKKEVDATLKLAEAKATLAREQAELWHAKGVINQETRLNLEIGAYEELDRVQTQQLKALKGMPLEYAQLQTANIKTQQGIVELTEKLNTLTNSFHMSSLGMQALKENVQAGLFHGPVEETERLAKNISLLNPSETPKLLQPSLWNALKTSIMGVGSNILAVDDATAKLIETYQDPSIDKMLATERKIADTQIERIDLLEKLNKLSGFDASAQKLAIMQKQLQNLEATKASYAGIVDENSALAIEILKVKAGIQQLNKELSATGQMERVFKGLMDIFSLFGVKVGKFIIMLQGLPRAMGGIREVFAGLGGLMTLGGTSLGAGTAWADTAKAVLNLGNASGETAGALGFLSGAVNVVMRTLMLFANGLTGILGFFSQIVQGIAAGGGIVNTITSAFSGLVSSGGMLATVFGGISTVGGSIMNAFQGVGGLADVFQSVFNAVGLTSGGFGSGAAVAGGQVGVTGAAGQFATFLGQWVPVAGALYALATTIQDFFAGRLEKAIGATIGTAIGAAIGSWVGPGGTLIGAVLGNFIGGFIGGLFAPTPKIKLSAGIAPFDRNAMGSAIDTTVPGTQVGAGIVNISGNIMKNKKERALQELLATMINEMLITVVDATVLMIKTLPPAIGAQLDAALTDLEATGLEIVDKKWKGGKAGKKFNKRVKGLMEETLQDLVTALDFGDVDLKALGFDPNDKKGKKGGEVARGFEAMMMALGGLSAIVKEVGPAVDLSGVSLAQFTKGAIDLFKGFAKEGEAFTDTIKRVMQTFGEIIALRDQIRASIGAISGDLTEVVAMIQRRMADAEAGMVSMVDALTVAIESGAAPEEVLAAAQAATQAVTDTLKMQIDAVTALHDAVLQLNSAITGGVDLIIDLTQKINELRGIETSASDFQFGLDGIVSLFNTLTDVTSRIALFQAGLIGMTTNLSLFMANLPLVVEGFNIIMAQIREMANPAEAVAALKGLAGAVESGLQAAVAAVNRQTQGRIAALMAERAAIVDSTAALRTQRTAMQEAFDAEKKGLEAQKALIRLPFTEQRAALEAEKSAQEALIAANRLVYEEQRAALETALSLSREWANVLQSVKAQLVDLFNLLAPTHPLTSLNEVQSQFDAAFAAFQAAPTPEGATGVQDLARQLLQLAQQTPGFDLPSANFQALAASVRTALTAIDTFASAQPTQEDIQAQIVALEELQTGTLDDINRQIQDLNASEAVALAGIDAQIDELQVSSDALLADIDSQIALLEASQAAALASIDARIAQANADGQASIQYLQELAAQGLEAIRNQLVIEVTALAAQQALAAAALQTVLGDKTYEQFIAEKQREAANLLRGIDETLQYYLGQILTKLFPGATVSQPVSPARLQEAVSGLSTLAQLAQGGNFTSLAQSLASASQAASVGNVGGVTSSLTAATQNMAGLSYFQSGPGAGFLSQLQEINSLTQQSQFVAAISRVTQLIDAIHAAGVYTQTPVPGYAEGTAFVPSTGMALLHRGERVLTSDENKMYSRWNGGGATTTNITFAPTIQITGTTNARKMADEIEDALVEKMQTGSRLRQATKALVGGRG